MSLLTSAAHCVVNADKIENIPTPGQCPQGNFSHDKVTPASAQHSTGQVLTWQQNEISLSFTTKIKIKEWVKVRNLNVSLEKICCNFLFTCSKQVVNTVNYLPRPAYTCRLWIYKMYNVICIWVKKPYNSLNFLLRNVSICLPSGKCSQSDIYQKE